MAATAQKITVRSYDITVDENKYHEGLDYAVDDINIWCLDQNSNPCLVRIQNFPTICYVELPSVIDNKRVIWQASGAAKVFRYLQLALGENAPFNYRFEMCKKLYEYHPGVLYPMLMLLFHRSESLRHCVNLLRKKRIVKSVSDKEIKLEVWESQIPSIRKLFSARRVSYTQWFSIEGRQIPNDDPDRISDPGSSDHPRQEYIAKWETMTPISATESQSWFVHPGIMSFDIETYSDNHRAMPVEYNIKHAAYMISCIYQHLGEPKSRKRYGIIFGDCDDIDTQTADGKESKEAKAMINDENNEKFAEIIRVNSEYALVEAMTHVFKITDPQIVIGYNILQYDYHYLNTRISLVMKEWPNITCLLNKIPFLKSRTWRSSGYGYNSVDDLRMDGRVNIDMLMVVKRGYKFDKYDLNSVSKFFLKKSKHDVKAAKMFEIYEGLQDAMDDAHRANIYNIPNEIETDYKVSTPPRNNRASTDEEKTKLLDRLNGCKREMARTMRYCLQDSELVIDLFEKLETFHELMELSSIMGVPTSDLFTRGQQTRCLAQLYDLTSKEDIPIIINRRIAAILYYVGGLVGEPTPGITDNAICLDFAGMYPSIMRAFNICFTTLIPKELWPTIPIEHCNVIEFDQEEPSDFKAKEFKGKTDEGPIEGVDEEKVDEEEDEDKTVVRHYEFRFIKAEFWVGVLPRLVAHLVEGRAAVKDQIKSLKKELEKYSHKDEISTLQKQINTSRDEKDRVTLQEKITKLHADRDAHSTEITQINVQLIVLDKRQNALKVSANSMYGFLGAQKGGVLPLIEGAMSVTAKGRQLITQVGSHLKGKYGAEAVYGDTDSIMFRIQQLLDSKDCGTWGKKLEDEISGVPEHKDKEGRIIPEVKGLFPKPLRMEFEKAMRILLFGDPKQKKNPKKRYAALIIDKNGLFTRDESDKYYILTRGIVLARRDNCPQLRNIYRPLLESVLLRKPINYVYEQIINAVVELLSGQVLIQNLAIVKELGSNYKNKNFSMNVFAEDLRASGQQVQPGDRLEYVIVKTAAEQDGKVLLGKKMREISQYMETIEEKKQEELDVVYYLEHMFQSAIDQLFYSGYIEELKEFVDREGNPVGYKTQYSRLHDVPVRTPIKMISQVIKDFERGGYSMDDTIAYIKTLPKWFNDIKTAIDYKKSHPPPRMTIRRVTVRRDTDVKAKEVKVEAKAEAKEVKAENKIEIKTEVKAKEVKVEAKENKTEVKDHNPPQPVRIPNPIVIPRRACVARRPVVKS